MSATCSDDFWAATNFLGKPAVVGSEHIEVWSYIKSPKSELKSSHQMQTVTNNPDALTGQGGNSHVPYEKTYIVHVTSIEYWLPVKNQP